MSSMNTEICLLLLAVAVLSCAGCETEAQRQNHNQAMLTMARSLAHQVEENAEITYGPKENWTPQQKAAVAAKQQAVVAEFVQGTIEANERNRQISASAGSSYAPSPYNPYVPSVSPKNYTVINSDGSTSQVWGHPDGGATVINSDGSTSQIWGH